MIMPSCDFAMIGLGTMGRNFLLNASDHGYAVAGYDRDSTKTSLLLSSASPGTAVKSVESIQELVAVLKPPRRIMMLVPAGTAVDAVLEDLLPFVSPGDIIIDGGNSHYKDTAERIARLTGKGVHFTGMGVSGGEEGARYGPSIMPGGSREAWQALQPLLEAVAARVKGDPCVAYMGNGPAGHYVKMVHNGIEYAIMQMISEVYDLMRKAGNMDNETLHDVFKTWNDGDLQSFLIEITAAIFREKDPISGNHLVDMILDQAGSKGTGKWTSQEAMDLHIPVPSIDIAVALRDLSGYRDERLQAAAVYRPAVKKISTDRPKWTSQLGDALYAGMMLAYAQGLAMLQKASAERNLDIPLADVVRIWRGGCIIRSKQLDLFTAILARQPQLPNILLSKKLSPVVKRKMRALRKTVQQSVGAGVPCNALASAAGYFDAYSSDALPVNLLQAQRDYFGAHTYQRHDREGNYHTNWGH